MANTIDKENMSETISGLMRNENVFELRRYLKETISQYGWNDVRTAFDEAISRDCGGYDSEYWYRIQYVTLETFHTPCLAGYEGSLEKILKDIPDVGTFQDVQKRLRHILLDKMKEQVVNGSTLFLRPDMMNKQLAELTPLIKQERLNRIKEIPVHKNGGKYDLRDVCKTHLGFKTVTELGLGLETDENGFDMLSSRIRTLGGKVIEGEKRTDFLEDIPAKILDMTYKIVSFCNSSKERDIREFRKLFHFGYPLSASVVLEMIGSIQDYRLQSKQAVPVRTLPEEIINTKTMLTFQDLYASSPSAMDALGKAKTTKSYEALKSMLRMQLKGVVNRDFHYAVMKQLYRYNDSSVIPSILNTLENLYTIETGPSVLAETVPSEAPATLLLAYDLLRIYNYPHLIPLISTFLLTLNSEDEAVMDLGYNAAVYLMQLGTEDAIRAILPFVHWVAPSRVAYSFTQNKPILDMVADNYEKVLPVILDILDGSFDDLLSSVLGVMERIGDPAADALIHFPEKVANAIFLNEAPLRSLQLTLFRDEIAGHPLVEMAIEGRADVIIQLINDRNYGEEFIWDLTRSQSLVSIDCLAEYLSDFSKRADIDPEMKEHIESALDGNLYSISEDPLGETERSNLIKKIRASEKPWDVLTDNPKLLVDYDGNLVETIGDILMELDHPRRLLCVLRGHEILVEPAIVESISALLESQNEPWRLLAEISTHEELPSESLIKKAAVDRLPDIIDALAHRPRINWVLESIDTIDYLITNSDLQKAVCETIQKGENTLWIAVSASMVCLAGQEAIAKAIQTQIDDIARSVYASSYPFDEIRCVINSELLINESPIKQAIAKAILSCKEPVYLLGLVRIVPSLASNEDIMNALLDRVDTMAELLENSNMQMETLSVLKDFPEIISHPAILQRFVESLQSSDDYTTMLAIVSEVEELRKNEDVINAVVSRISSPVDIVRFATSIRSKDTLLNPSITSKIAQAINQIEPNKAKVYQQLGRNSIERALFGEMGILLTDNEIQQATHDYILRCTDPFHLKSVMKSLLDSEYPRSRLIETYITGLESDRALKFIESLKEKETKDLLHSMSIQNAIADAVRSSRSPAEILSEIKGIEPLWSSNIINDAIDDALESSSNPAALADAIGIESFQDSNKVQGSINSQMKKIADRIRSTKEPLELILEEREKHSLLEHDLAKAAIESRIDEIANAISASEDSLQYEIGRLPQLLEYKPIRDAICVNFAKHGASLYSFDAYAKYEDILASPNTSKGVARNIETWWDIEKKIERIQKYPQLFNSKEVQKSLEKRRKNETPEYWVEKGKQLLKENDLHKSMKALEKAVRLGPEHRDAHYWLARGYHRRRGRMVKDSTGGAYVNMGDIRNAEREYRKCIEIDSHDEEAWQGLVQLLRDTGQSALAEQAVKDSREHLTNV